MNEIAPRERTGRVVAFTLAAWGALVAASSLDGVLAKLPDAVLSALAIFATGYAVATYFVDRTLREYARGTARGSLALAAWVLVGVLALLGGISSGAPLLSHWALALAAFFAAPLALVTTVAALERAFALRLSAAKRPAGRPAAT